MPLTSNLSIDIFIV
jgi:hypothetical protein